MRKQEIIDRNPSALWRYLLDEASGSGSLILVNNLLMEREVRRKWQRDRRGFAPDIRTLESWMEELALHSLEESRIPAVILTAEERSLWLEQWLAGHPRKEFRRFAGMRSVTALSNIIGELYRENRHPGALYTMLQGAEDAPVRRGVTVRPDKGPSSRVLITELLADYERKLTENNWVDREQLAAGVKRFRTDLIRHEKLVLYQIDELSPLQEQVLDRILDDGGDGGPRMVHIRYGKKGVAAGGRGAGSSTEKTETGVPHAGEERPVEKPHTELPRQDSLSDTGGGRLGMDVFHHPREELEQAVRHILASVSREDVAGARSGQAVDDRASESPPSGSGQPDNAPPADSTATRFDDFVILTGDLSLYEELLPVLSERFRVPLYTSRGPSLISHPFVRRILTYLKLDHNDFQVDDVFRVFADNRLVLPELQDHDEQKAPNIRHFSQFCRAYNFRTLREVSEGMGRVFDGLLEHIAWEEDEEKETRRREGLRRDREFYREVIRHLEALREQYKTETRQRLGDWVQWTRGLLDLQRDLMSREANEARQLLEVILEKLSAAGQRLGLGESISRNDFFRLLELRLKETRERPEEKPGGVLVTEIRHLPEVHDKVVYVLGLHEEGFPKPDRADFLQFRYEKALRKLTGREGTEEYDIARRQLERLLASGRPRFLSRPAHVAQKPVMPSPLWLDLEDQVRLAGHRLRSMSRLPDRTPRTGGAGAPLVTRQDIALWILNHRADGAGRGAPDTDAATRTSEKNRQPSLFEMHTEVPEENSVMEKVGPELREQIRPFIRQMKLAAAVQQERRDFERMGRYDGVIRSGWMSRWWTQRDNTGPMKMSISRLDSFAASPQEFFFKYMLRLQPLHEYQDDAESNIKGSLLHHILQEFYTETEQEGPPVWPAEDPGTAEKRMERIRERLVGDYRHQMGNPESPFPDILKKNLERVTRWFLEVEKEAHPDINEDLSDLKPAVFYPGSGFSMEHSWEFEERLDGVDVVFRGMIDRIDLSGDGKAALIYDYKSGGSGVQSYKGRICKGLSFQLPVYGMYLRKRGIPHFLAGYYKLPINGKKKDVQRICTMGSAEMMIYEKVYTGKGTRNGKYLHYKMADELDAFLEAIRTLRVSWILKTIREGRFHVSLTGQPKWSDYRHISRYDERVQRQRKNVELSRRMETGLRFELDRYYLDEPFWEDGKND
ncbi:exodeoxyribonuclease V subunit gamma [Balneolales bacterium ANBcel1]|nr:exodeoxyribonuclease V subunit gamma [Balneolales bacterium ANBcel1]